MDRITSIVGFCAMYSSMATINILIHTPPAELSDKKKWDYMGQHISLIHATSAVLMGFFVYCLEGGVHYSESTNFYHVLVLSVRTTQHSLGYFFYDMIFAEIFRLHDWAMRIHHCCVLVGGTILYMAGSGGSIAILCLIITEGSNPFMMIRKILRAKGMQDSFGYKVVEVVFAASFVVLRTVPCSFVNYNVWVADLSLITKLAISITYAVGFFWIFTIFNIGVKQIDPENHWGNKARSALGFVKKNQSFFVPAVFVWAVLVPFYCSQIKGTGFINVKIGEFIVM